MTVSYKKLWKLLIDKDIKKKDLSSMAGVSPANKMLLCFHSGASTCASRMVLE